MKKQLLLLVLLLFVSSFLASAEESKLWFKHPASNWNEALPVGNGRLGAMVFGGATNERLQLNEETVWSHGLIMTDKPGGHKYIKEIQDLLFEGKYTEAQNLCQQKLLQERPESGTNSYQTLGDLNISFNNITTYNNYRRELQLDNALVKTTFTANGSKHTRTVFSSAVDQAIVMMAEASKEGQISCNINLSRPGEGEIITVHDGMITMNQKVNNNGVNLEAKVIVINHGGKMSINDKDIVVTDADKVEIRIVAATDYRGVNPTSLCDKYASDIKNTEYSKLIERHIEEYKGYFDRVSLDLEPSAAALFPTDERLDAQKRGAYDPSLASLYFQFGRYLLISSSRPGCMPSNLQGIWADGLKPPWNADYHVNINIQMNYWPSEITNLSECHMPFINFIDDLRENGRKTAKESYGVKGFTAHHTTDAWHFTSSFGKPRYGMWPMGAAWSATHIWEHYLFTNDKQFLSETGYPIMREAAQFLSEMMVKNPHTGKWVTGPSMSPENEFLTPDGSRGSISMGPAMDLQIVWHLFKACISASEELDTDKRFSKKLQSQLDNLTPVNIGADGRILEWSTEELKEAMPGHRHMSHLYGLYPSNEYNWNTTPEYMEAAKKVLEERLKHGGGHTGWSRAWMINFYARLQDKDKAWESITMLWSKSTLPNMFDNHPPFQIDGNFGGTAGIAEILLQSHAGEIHLLPCLPTELPKGEVKGLMARGGNEVSITWENGKLVKASVKSKNGKVFKIRYEDKVLEFTPKEGEVFNFNNKLEVI